MKSYINKFFIGVAAVAMLGLGSCVNDLDQLPQDPNVYTGPTFAENPREYLGGVLAKCYAGMAISGQDGAGSSDMSGLDAGTSQYSRTLFMLNEFPTDEVMWLYQDAGVPELVQGTWSTGNVNIFGAYSRFYVHIAVCNDFIRLTRSLGDYGVQVGGSGDKAISQAEIDQFVLEARALRAMSYYNVIDLFGNGVLAWDDMAYGDVPPQKTRTELYDKVVADLEDVLAHFSDATPVYGRIGKDAVEALLARFYLNAEVFTGTPAYDKCWNHCQNIMARHTGGYNGTGMAKDYLSIFCGNNDMFMPGGALADQNEILWGIPFKSVMTECYGATKFLISAALKNMGDPTKPGEGFCNQGWYGINDTWSCMHARKEFSDKFNFDLDKRAYLWLREDAGFVPENSVYDDFQHGYASIKFTNVLCNADGSMPMYKDEETGLNRCGIKDQLPSVTFPDTDMPVIRLADVYLMAAECALRGAGNRAQGLAYVNQVRTRAGLAAWLNPEYTLDNLCDERARELYWENVRRTDLIRFGKFVSGYNWSWKGNIEGGTNIDSYRTLYPLPADVIATYGSSMKQNPGY